MPSIIASNRVPDNLDYASPSQFKFQISRIPEVEYFIVATNIPQISLSGDAEINTPFKQVAFGGDTGPAVQSLTEIYDGTSWTVSSTMATARDRLGGAAATAPAAEEA